MNKRAVSPLIATVLLIAFAVSLGAVVMNWTSSGSSYSGDSEGGSSANAVCADVSITVLNKGSSKAICLDREARQLVIDLENGPRKIDGLRLSYLSSTSEFVDYNKEIQAGILTRIELDYDPVLFGELRNVKIVPTVQSEDLVYCTTKDISFSIIEDC